MNTASFRSWGLSSAARAAFLFAACLVLGSSGSVWAECRICRYIPPAGGGWPGCVTCSAQLPVCLPRYDSIQCLYETDTFLITCVYVNHLGQPIGTCSIHAHDCYNTEPCDVM